MIPYAPAVVAALHDATGCGSTPSRSRRTAVVAGLRAHGHRRRTPTDLTFMSAMATAEIAPSADMNDDGRRLSAVASSDRPTVAPAWRKAVPAR